MKRLAFAKIGSVLRTSFLNLALTSLTMPCPSMATGTVSNCTESELRTALAGGGLVTFAVGGTIGLTAPLEISEDTRIDGTGYNITLDGSNAVRLITISPGVTLELKGITLANGFAQGTNGNAGQSGGSGEGGAVLNTEGTLRAENCHFLGNRAQGGTGGLPSGGFPPPVGTGGLGRGGAIQNRSGLIALTNCWLANSGAIGGNGGNTAGTIATSFGGEAHGGAIYNQSGTVYLVQTILSNNLALAGQGRRFGTLSGSAASFGGGLVNEGNLFVLQSELSANRCLTEYTARASGGGIHQKQGVLQIESSLLQNNRVIGGDGLGISTPLGIPGGPAFGGALHVLAGSASVSRSTVSDNAAIGGAGMPSGAGSGQGGGLYNSGSTVLTNCTITGNLARGGEGRSGSSGDGEGGGLYHTAAGSLLVSHGTIASNSASKGPGGGTIFTGIGRGGAVASAGATITLRNSILAHSLSGSNWFGPAPTDDGNNLSSDVSCPLSAPGSVVNVDPLLGPLWNYGGPTPTMALRAGSPAINAGLEAFCPPTDQRGRSRPFGPACDIGAFESSSPYFVIGQITGYHGALTTIEMTSDPATATPDALGRYSLADFTAGDHLLTPHSPEIVFIPSNRVVSVSADVVNVDYHSYRSNALVMERISGEAIRGVFAGEAQVTYRVLTSTNLTDWTLWSTNVAESSGLFEFFNAATSPAGNRYFQAVRP